jgi:fatty-acyl-CoA synthase
MGVKQVYPGRYDPAVLLGLVQAEKVTFSHCVPTILHMILGSPAAQQTDLSRWKMIIGGSALPKALCKAALARGIDIFTGYGMSETCPILTLAHVSPEMGDLDEETRVGIRCKTGRPLPLVDLRIVDETMGDVPHDGKATGEIVVRAPWLTQGYLKEEKASERLWHGGWLHTGDVAHRDARGWVKITDRTKDVIKIGGEWVSSLELEDILAQHPAVAEVAVIGMPDAKWGEKPLALVVPKPGAAADEKTLRHHAHTFVEKGMVTRQAVLLEIRIVDAIDKTSVGKVNKVALRQKHLPQG